LNILQKYDGLFITRKLGLDIEREESSRAMNFCPEIKSRVINREIDLKLLLCSLQAKPFAISPPIEVDGSFMVGLASRDPCEGVCIHMPVSAIPQVAGQLFTNGDGKTPIYVHSLKQLIKPLRYCVWVNAI